MVVVIPFCTADTQLVERNLKWAIQLDKRVPFTCLLSVEAGTNLDSVRLLAEQYFDKVEIMTRHRWDGDPTWPMPGNYAFQQTAEHIKPSKRPWFWWEPDMSPLRKGWIKEISDEYESGGKPFMGAIVNRHGGYMAGCGVYPADVSAYSARMMLALDIPWDVFGGREIMGGVHDASHLICHEAIEREDHKAFDVERLRGIGKEAVVYHPCKDGSLIQLLANSKGLSIQKIFEKFVGIKKAKFEEARKPVRVRRAGAIGDVIMASAVAQKLHEHGYAPTLECVPACAVSLQNHPLIKVETGNGKLQASMDGVYESIPLAELKSKPITRIFAEATYKQLAKSGIEMNDYANLTPQLYLTDQERAKALSILEAYPKPWIAVCPRSNSFKQRTVPQHIWSAAAKQSGVGTWFWTGTDLGPDGLVDLTVRQVRGLMGILGSVDLAVSVDSGPAHLAAGLGTPLLMVTQNISPMYTLPDQRDWNDVSTGLECLSCRLDPCPISPERPPCGLIDPMLIVEGVHARLRSLTSNDVSAVIPFYRASTEDTAKMDRLNRCISAASPQVSEIVIAVDGGSSLAGMVPDRKVKVVRPISGTRGGFGRACNLGARNSNGRHIMLLNDDLYLEPGAVGKMLEVMDHRTAVVGCLLWFPDGTIQHGGTSRRKGDIGWGHIDHHQAIPTVVRPMEMENVTYAVAVIRRTAYYQVRGFDESYDVYCEDNDLNLRLRQAGWKVMYTPHAQAIHEESKTTSPMKQKLAEEATKVFRKKWGWYFQKNANNTMGTFT